MTLKSNEKNNFQNQYQESYAQYKEAEKKNEEKVEDKEQYRYNADFYNVDYYQFYKNFLQIKNEYDNIKNDPDYSDSYKKYLENKLDQSQDKINNLGTKISTGIKQQIEKDAKNFLELQNNPANTLSTTEKSDALKREYTEGRELTTKQFTDFFNDLLNRLGSKELKKFYKKHCLFELDQTSSTNTWEINKDVDKLIIKVSKSFVYDKSEHKLMDIEGNERYITTPRLDKLSFIFGQTVGKIIEEPDNWKEIAPKIQITENTGQEPSWIDFCGLCMSLPQEAEQQSKEAYNFFIKRINQIQDFNKISLKGNQKNPNPKINVDFSKEKIIGEKKYKEAKKFWGNAEAKSGISFITTFLIGMAQKHTREYWIENQTTFPKSTYYERTIASVEDKEVATILMKNDNAKARDQLFRALVGDGSELVTFQNAISLRALLTADCKTADLIAWRLHAVLLATDRLYRETNGEEITEDSFNFVQRCHRLSQGAGKRIGSKAPEYKEVSPGQTYEIFDAKSNTYKKYMSTRTKYVRISQRKVMAKCLEQFEDTNVRTVSSGLAKDVVDQLKDADDRLLNNLNETYYKFIEITDNMSDKEKLAAEKHNEQADNQYTGRISSYMSPKFVKRLMDTMNSRENIRKLTLDGIAAIAFIIAKETYFENIEDLKELGVAKESTSKGGGKRIITGEHTRPFLKEAYDHFKPLFCNDPDFRSYINYFLRKDGFQINGYNNATNKAIIGLYDPSQDLLLDFKNHQDIEEKIIDEEYKRSTDLRMADELVNLYDNLPQDTELNIDNNINRTDNTLKNAFFFKNDEKERTHRDCAKDINEIENAIKIWENKLENKISNLDCDERIKEIIFRFTLANRQKEPTDQEKITIPLILNDVITALEQELFNQVSSTELEKMKSQLEDIMVIIRPLRKKYIRLYKFRTALNYQPYIDLARKQFKDILNKPGEKEKFTQETTKVQQKIQQLERNIEKFNAIDIHDSIAREKNFNEIKETYNEIANIIPDSENSILVELKDKLSNNFDDRNQQMLLNTKELLSVLEYFKFTYREKTT